MRKNFGLELESNIYIYRKINFFPDFIIKEFDEDVTYKLIIM